MPKLTRRLTDSVARSLPAPAPKPATSPPKLGKRPSTAYEIHWCRDTPGFGVRITETGARSWIFERRVDNETKRRTLGKVTGRGAISGEEARKQAIETSADLQRGDDPLKVKQEQAKLARSDIEFGDAVLEYVENKIRAKDEKGLKVRTKAGYLAMIAPPGISRKRGFIGQPTAAGYLFPLVRRPLRKITGDDIRELHVDIKQKRGKRAASLAMQLLRAVLNWHGMQLPDSPFSKQTPGRDRIIISSTVGDPKPIPPEKLGTFWRAACLAGVDGNRGSEDGAACVRLVLLTGARSGESAGNQYVEGILVRDVDMAGARITLTDTKNRLDHVIYLSRQALEIVKGFAKGKKAADRLLPVQDVGKTLDAICAAAGVERKSIHEVRKTFASIADELVSGYTLKRMMNHMPGDVTGNHYVGKSESQLRKGWQAVADFIEEEAQAAPDVAFPKKGVRVSRKAGR